MRLLSLLLGRAVRVGRLTILDFDGSRHEFGAGGGASVSLRFHDAGVAREIFRNPELKTAETYMDGRLTLEGGTIHDLLRLHSENREGFDNLIVQMALRSARWLARRLQQANPLGLAAANVQHHYDIPTPFYRLWLDPSMSYSCAYFPTPETSLADAQRAKMRHVAAKLRIEPGMTVVDIGSGWGGLAIYLAEACGAKVTGVNVSHEQLAASRALAAERGIADRVTFVEADYRELEGRFDRVVSVGMMEHVGAPNFDAYFQKVKDLLAPRGVALIHAIGRIYPPGTTSPFLRKYIFPGGYTPALSEVFAALERVPLWCADCENLRMHYYWTIGAWRRAYEARRHEAVAMMGERFCRMWDFYLSAVEFSFLSGGEFVFQLLLSEAQTAVPVTRDYTTREEARLAAAGH